MPRSKKYSGGARPKSKNNFAPNKFQLDGDSEGSDSDTNGTKFCSDINGSLTTYKLLMNEFRKSYSKWLPERQNTLQKLREMVEEVHKEQLAFNKNGLLFKEANTASRQFRNEDNPNMDFFSSLAAFLTDAADGVNSIIQAVSVDKYMEQFGEIMDHDAEITKPMHSIRSKCFTQYHNIEDIIRRYHSETFGSTMDRISRSLKTEDMWLEVKSSRNSNNIAQVISAVDGVLQQLSKVEVLSEIRESVGNYVDSNPAVLEALESTGKALYGAYDTWGRKRDPEETSAVSSTIYSGVNRALIMRNQREIMRLRSLTLEEDSSQAKLETKIREAIEDLEKEAYEMKMLYNSLGHTRIY